MSNATIDLLRQRITELVLKRPDKAAVILAQWLKQGTPAKAPPKKKAA